MQLPQLLFTIGGRKLNTLVNGLPLLTYINQTYTKTFTPAQTGLEIYDVLRLDTTIISKLENTDLPIRLLMDLLYELNQNQRPYVGNLEPQSYMKYLFILLIGIVLILNLSVIYTYLTAFKDSVVQHTDSLLYKLMLSIFKYWFGIKE